MKAIAMRAAYVAMVAGILWAADRYPRSTSVALIAGWVLVGSPERADNKTLCQAEGTNESDKV